MRRVFTLAALAALLACGDGGGDERGGPGGRGGGMPGAMGAGGSAAAVPVEVVPVERRTISAFIETNGALEAENEVDLVARVNAPIVELLVEEGDLVQEDQLLARLDDVEYRVQVEIARVQLAETRQSYERAQTLRRDELISPEQYESTVAAFDSARAQLEAAEIQLAFTDLRAPFAGRIVRRYVDRAQQVSANTALYRLSDFDPLLCVIQIPERDLPRVSKGQAASLEVEAYPGERFDARVLRISPVVDAETGTFKVTLVADTDRRLRPGMFARVFVEAERRTDTLVVPKAALSLESIGDTVYVAAGGVASRREVEIGYRQGDSVELLSGVEAGELVVVVGQDGLSDGTPLQILSGDGAETAATTGGAEPPAAAAAGNAPDGGRGGRPQLDFAKMTDEQIEQVKQRMRDRGMSDEQIERIIRARREGANEPPAE